MAPTALSVANASRSEHRPAARQYLMEEHTFAAHRRSLSPFREEQTAREGEPCWPVGVRIMLRERSWRRGGPLRRGAASDLPITCSPAGPSPSNCLASTGTIYYIREAGMGQRRRARRKATGPAREA